MLDDSAKVIDRLLSIIAQNLEKRATFASER
jgi:hypothetical protein